MGKPRGSPLDLKGSLSGLNRWVRGGAFERLHRGGWRVVVNAPTHNTQASRAGQGSGEVSLVSALCYHHHLL
jgi:hypothetical protein